MQDLKEADMFIREEFGFADSENYDWEKIFSSENDLFSDSENDCSSLSPDYLEKENDLSSENCNSGEISPLCQIEKTRHKSVESLVRQNTKLSDLKVLSITDIDKIQNKFGRANVSKPCGILNSTTKQLEDTSSESEEIDVIADNFHYPPGNHENISQKNSQNFFRKKGIDFIDEESPVHFLNVYKHGMLNTLSESESVSHRSSGVISEFEIQKNIFSGQENSRSQTWIDTIERNGQKLICDQESIQKMASSSQASIQKMPLSSLASSQKMASSSLASSQKMASSSLVSSQKMASSSLASSQKMASSYQTSSQKTASSYQTSSQEMASSYQTSSQKMASSYQTSSQKMASSYQESSQKMASSYQESSQKMASSYQASSQKMASSYQASCRNMASSNQSSQKMVSSDRESRTISSYPARCQKMVLTDRESRTTSLYPASCQKMVSPDQESIQRMISSSIECSQNVIVSSQESSQKLISSSQESFGFHKMIICSQESSASQKMSISSQESSASQKMIISSQESSASQKMITSSQENIGCEPMIIASQESFKNDINIAEKETQSHPVVYLSTQEKSEKIISSRKEFTDHKSIILNPKYCKSATEDLMNKKKSNSKRVSFEPQKNLLKKLKSSRRMSAEKPMTLVPQSIKGKGSMKKVTNIFKQFLLRKSSNKLRYDSEINRRIQDVRKRELLVTKLEDALKIRQKLLAEQETKLLKRERLLKIRERKLLNCKAKSAHSQKLTNF